MPVLGQTSELFSDPQVRGTIDKQVVHSAGFSVVINVFMPAQAGKDFLPSRRLVRRCQSGLHRSASLWSRMIPVAIAALVGKYKRRKFRRGKICLEPFQLLGIHAV